MPSERIIKSILILLPYMVLTSLSFFFRLVDYLPGLVFAPIIGIILGYFLVSANNTYAKILFAAVPILISIWVFSSFSKIWQDFMIYRTFGTGEIVKDAPNFTFHKDDLSLNNTDFKGQTTVFFFWNTSCPYTPRYLPSLKKKQEKFSNNKAIKFYTVNIPLPRDSVKSDSIYLSKHALNIERLKGPKIENMYKVFGQAPIPLTMILNPEGKIVYWGNIDKIDHTLNKLIR